VELPQIRAMLVSLHTAVIGHRPQFDVRVLARTDQARMLEEARTGRRCVWFERGWQATPIFSRTKFPLDAEFLGPAVVEQLDAITPVEPGDLARLDALGNLVIEVRP
jgi:N-methylhydantoinase A